MPFRGQSLGRHIQRFRPESDPNIIVARDGRLTDFLESSVIGSVIGSVLTAVRTEPFIIGSVPVPHGNRNRTENKLKYFNRP